MSTHVTPECRCPICQAKIDRATNSPADEKGEPKPMPGDPTVCFQCGGLLVFNDDMTVSEMTDAQIEERFNEDERKVIMKTQRLVKRFRNL